MKVYDPHLTGTTAAATGRTRETDQAERAAGASAIGGERDGDCVERSSTLERAFRALAADGLARAAKLQALAVQYQSGQYRAGSAATSQALIAETLAATAKNGLVKRRGGHPSAHCVSRAASG